MVVFKKHLLKIVLLLILLSAGILCVHSVWNYNGNNSSTLSKIGQVNIFPGRDNRPSIAPDQKIGGQLSTPVNNQRMAFPRGGMRPSITSVNTSKDYSPQLLIYAAIFLVLSIAAYFLFIYKKFKIAPDQARMLILTLLGAGLFLRISIATLIAGHPFDLNTFKSWATAAANNLFQVYSSSRSSDYPPLYMYILFLIGKIGSIPAMSPYYTLLLKLPSIIADIATSYLIYKLARRYLSLELGILLSAFYIFNPAVFINSAIWGQVDSFFTLIVVGSMFMLSERRIGLASVLFTAAVLMKPQGIIFLPILFSELLRQKNLKNMIKAAVLAVGTAIIIVLPFSANHDALWIFKLFSQTVGEYPYASVNAFNLFSLLGANYKSDATPWLFLTYHSWGMIFIVLVTAYSWFIYIKGNSLTLVPAAALFQIAGVFTLAASMHERYLFPAVALAILAFIYLKDKRFLFLAGGFSASVYINTHMVLFQTIQGIDSVLYSPALIITSLLNVLLLTYLGKVIYHILPCPIWVDNIT